MSKPMARCAVSGRGGPVSKDRRPIEGYEQSAHSYSYGQAGRCVRGRKDEDNGGLGGEIQGGGGGENMILLRASPKMVDALHGVAQAKKVVIPIIYSQAIDIDIGSRR